MDKKRGIVILLVLIIISLIGLEYGLTGKSILELDAGHMSGNVIISDGKLEGNIEVIVKEGELIPIGSEVVVSQSGNVSKLNFSEVVDVNANGSYYVEGKGLDGQGAGYGFIGSKQIYPNISFTLVIEPDEEVGEDNETEQQEDNETIINETEPQVEINESENETEQEEEQDNESIQETEVNETQQVEQEEQQEEAVDEEEEQAEEEQEQQAEEEPVEEEAVEEEGVAVEEEEEALITGGVVRDVGKREIEASVNALENFEYNLDGETAYIKEGSVFSEYNVSENDLNIDLSDEQVVVSTDYFIDEEGYGQDYLGNETHILKIPLDNFDFEIDGGLLKIELVYGDEVLAEVSKMIVSNASMINQTSNFSIIKQIADITIPRNTNYSLDLDEYFENAENYFINYSKNMSYEFIGSNLLLIPDKDYIGMSNITLTALNGNDSLKQTFVIRVIPAGLQLETSRYTAVINKPVRWHKKVRGNLSHARVDLPEKAKNVSIKLGKEVEEAEELAEKEEEEIDKKSFLSGKVVLDIELEEESLIDKILDWFKGITGRAVSNISNSTNESIGIGVNETQQVEVINETGNKTIEISTNETEALVEYYTDAPVANETSIKNGKRVVVSADSSLGYKDVLAYTLLDGVDRADIKLYWYDNVSVDDLGSDNLSGNVSGMENMSLEQEVKQLLNASKFSGNKQEVNFSAYDLSGNGKIDYIEWIVPHLSSQVYEVVIEVSKAQHLDVNRSFINDIYEDVKAKDNNWTGEIVAGHYVRVWFERNLTSSNDITIYPNITLGEPVIKIYEIDGEDVIAEFSDIESNAYNKVYLTGLNSSQDSFDLQVLNGSLMFDYITDPSSCTPPASGIWQLNCSDNCVFSEDINITGDVNISGTGVLNISANWNFNSTGQEVYVYPGCELNIYSGGGFNIN
ncbi:MAG: hypothetical protein ACP5D2_01040 [Candidatus Nanoarchaeia archaeon]